MLFRLSDIWKSYAGNEILKGVSFQVNPAEKIGLVGRNGAGKTTVFRIITGKEAADSGDFVKMNGLKIGLLDQHVDFAEDETVHEAALSAFEEIRSIELKMRELEELMQTDHSEQILDSYADLQTNFYHLGGFSYASKAESILFGLGFGREMWQESTRTLSGGQKNRLGMVRLLLSDVDVMLLDEPTNHLDVEAVEWLEGFLAESDKTYVVISHDRYFLDRVSKRIIEIDRGKAISYKGNYSGFLVERELRREQQQREFENQQAFINKTEEFIRRNLEGQKTKQAKSRRTMLTKLDRLDATVSDRSGGNFRLKEVERTGNNVLTTEELSIGYGKKVLGHSIDLSLHRGECLGIVGGNGTGKTTFLNTVTAKIPSIGGDVRWGTKVNIGYYSQNIDDLEPRNDVIQELRRVAPMAESGTLRGFLARFLFTGDDVFKQVSSLSGGEKGRLALAKLIYSEKNVLILDEPTNHLDIPAREALESALKEYTGTIIAVSHDRFFLDVIATHILGFEPNGKVLLHNGNYTEYHDWKRDFIEVQDWPNDPLSLDSSEPTPEIEKPLASGNAKNPLSKNMLNRLEQRIAEIEEELVKADEKIARLTEKMSDHKVVTDAIKLAEITNQVAEVQEYAADLTDEWEDLTLQLEAAPK